MHKGRNRAVARAAHPPSPVASETKDRELPRVASSPEVDVVPRRGVIMSPVGLRGRGEDATRSVEKSLLPGANPDRSW